MNELTFQPVAHTAIILSGGKGQRLKDIVADRQKTMAIVAKRPFIEWLLLYFSRQGVKRAVICTGYKSEHIKQHFAQRLFDNLTIEISDERYPLGTAGAIKQALKFTDDSTLLVANGDSFCHFALPKFIRSHHDTRALMTILATPINNANRYGSMIINENGGVIGFQEKSADHITGIINAGIYLIDREVINKLSFGRNISLEKELIPSLIPDKVFSHTSNGPFIDIGIPKDYSTAQAMFSDPGFLDTVGLSNYIS
jgi:D-glycero-alpha-D-manno-heptose 1-phosphate guanylyltransferase